MKPIGSIIKALEGQHGRISTNWHTRQEDPFRILISTMLSHRTKDEMTDRVSKALFSRYGTPGSLAEAPVADIEKLIRGSGYYHTKAARIKEAARIIRDECGGMIPDDISELVRIRGVGRKTAGCVLVYAFGKPAIPVDTHVHRISNRMGLVHTKTPEKTEQSLMKLVPKKHWLIFNALFVNHGKSICRPIGPICNECSVKLWCDYARLK